MNVLTWFGTEQGQLAIAGALGGAVRWLTLRDNWLDGVVSIIVGMICASYIAPSALPLLSPVLGNVGITAASTSGLSGFLIGIGGITVSGFFIDLWRARRLLARKEAPKPEGDA